MAMTRAVALALTVLTGFSGLVYEVAWEKYLATLLGSHSEATAAVLGIFLGGLSLGYSVFGRVTRSWVSRGQGARLLLLYGAVEGTIGAYVLCFPTLFEVAVRLAGVLPRGVTGLGFVLDVLLAAILIGPPAVLMGGTIPILTQALSRSAEDSTRLHALVYALNTAGAFLGALAAGFVLIPWLGLAGVMLAMGFVNLMAGASFFLLDRRGVPAGGGIAAEEPVEIPGFRSYALAAGMVGFAMMSLQTVLIRVGGLSLGASQFTFSMVVAVFVLCIALGSFGVSLSPRIPRYALAANQWLLVALLFGLYMLLPYAPYSAHVLRTLFRDSDPAFYGYFSAIFLAILVFIGPAVILSGATLPLLFHNLRQEVDALGRVAGRLYSWNTVGSLVGALLGGYALLFWLDLDQIYHLALGALIVAAVLLGTRVEGRTRRVSQVLGVAGLLALLVLGDWNARYFVYGPFRARKPTPETHLGPTAFYDVREAESPIVLYDDDPVASVAVTERTYPDGAVSRSIINNGKSDGSTRSDFLTTSLLGLLPALFAEKAESAFVIGYGTGITVGELMVLPTIERVVVSEISPAVVRAAPLFDFANNNVTKSPKVEILRSDAYRALLHSDESFDVIVSEPSNPWVQGIEMLFSREYLEAARVRLRRGGVYAQWYHQYSSDPATVELVLRTYDQVFDRVSVWYGLGPDLIILGFADGTRPLDLQRLEERVFGPAFRPGLKRSGIENLSQLLAHELVPLGVLRGMVRARALDGRVHTLVEPILGYTASRAFYRGGAGRLPFSGFGEPASIGRVSSLLARYRGRSSYAELYQGFCAQRHDDCVALLARWHRSAPRSPAVAKHVREAATKSKLFGGAVKPDEVVRVARLYPIAGEPQDRGPVPLPAARWATKDYVQYYLHALPFSREALIDIWKRCEEPPHAAGRCAKGLEEARNLVRHGGQGR
jgi:predicted membrane-bound spermidine synthase